MALLTVQYTAPLPTGFTSGTVELKAGTTYIDASGRVNQPYRKYTLGSDKSLTSLQGDATPVIVGMATGDPATASPLDVIVTMSVTGLPTPLRSTFRVIPLDTGSGTLNIHAPNLNVPAVGPYPATIATLITTATTQQTAISTAITSAGTATTAANNAASSATSAVTSITAALAANTTSIASQQAQVTAALANNTAVIATALNNNSSTITAALALNRSDLLTKSSQIDATLSNQNYTISSGLSLTLSASNTRRYATPTERNADAPPDGTWGFTASTGEYHRRETGAWVLRGSTANVPAAGTRAQRQAYAPSILTDYRETDTHVTLTYYPGTGWRDASGNNPDALDTGVY